MNAYEGSVERKRLYRRSEVPERLKAFGIHRSPNTLAKEHSLGTGVPVVAYDGRRPLHDDAGIASYAGSRITTQPRARVARLNMDNQKPQPADPK